MESRKSDKPQPGGEIKVNSTPKITDVKEISIQNLGKKSLSMDFEFLTSYEPEIGKITIEGNLLFLADSNEAVLKQWKKDKSLPEDVSVQVLNHLFRKCLIKMATMADELQLPPPIQIPRVKPKE